MGRVYEQREEECETEDTAAPANLIDIPFSIGDFIVAFSHEEEDVTDGLRELLDGTLPVDDDLFDYLSPDVARSYLTNQADGDDEDEGSDDDDSHAG